MNKVLIGIFAVLLLMSCENRNTFLKVKSPSHTHIEFANHLKDTLNQNILDYLYYYNGGGVALGDINNDGLTDIYFTSNQGVNKLYLNKGDLEFEDITEKAGVQGDSDWSSGVTMVDINQDGLLDIYICAVVGLNGFEGINELFINNGDLTFTEQASKYGLDIDNYSSNAAFFDYDLDGDLDMYLLNHAVHTQESFGDTLARHQRNYETGDKLFKNENGHYKDVSEEAGIFGGPNGYGLGLSIADFNQDGYPDIYVGNDFHEDDYFYVNNGDGTFTNRLKNHFGHISKFTMGMDNADINHDGFPDLMTLDMLSENPQIVHSSVNDENEQMMRTRTEKLGFTPQFARNMLQINQGGKQFSEWALMSGVAATDWSWSALFADFNQDGNQDLYITNGIPHRPNDLDYIQFLSNQSVKTKINHTNLIDEEAIEKMPKAEIKNYFFSGSGNGLFTNATHEATNEKSGISTGAAYADLDNDGDLDLVINNINAVATILENNTQSDENHYLKIKLQYPKPNLNAIGAKVFLYQKDRLQMKELFPVRGFQSYSEPIVHFGLGAHSSIDSVHIIWNDKTIQRLENIKANQLLKITYQPQDSIEYPLFNKMQTPLFQEVTKDWGISSRHQENEVYDFTRHKLIPYAISTLGPALAVGDLNHDGKDDIFFGGAKRQNSEILLQEANQFKSWQPDWLTENAMAEDISALILDVNQDQLNDLLIGEGGGEFSGTHKALQNRYFTQTSDGFQLTENDYFENASVIKSLDFDNDGDWDLFVGTAYDASSFGKLPTSYLLENQNGKWIQIQKFENLGMIRDAVVSDLNKDSKPDILVVGEWMQPTILKNVNQTFQIDPIGDEKLKGLWRAVELFDMDEDGDLDICLGNWGLNSKFYASTKHPLLMYYDDFDNNQTAETLIANYTQEDYYSFYGLQMLQDQLPEFRKAYPTYHGFATKNFNEILSKKQRDKAQLFESYELASGYLKNNAGAYEFIPFPKEFQVAPINCFETLKLQNQDALLCAGNFFGLIPYQGRFDAFSGGLLYNENQYQLTYDLGLNLYNQQISHMESIQINNEPYLVVAANNDVLRLFKIL